MGSPFTKEQLVRRLRNAADAAFFYGLTEEEIRQTVNVGVETARRTRALFDEDGDGVPDCLDRAA